MWYSNLYRRHLVDMHIEDDKELYLSEFSPEEYVENLKKCKANYAMIYLQSHVGLCYFPTKSGIMHKHFEKNPDAMRRVIDLCHENGIKVMAYYSLIYNTREHDRRPKWRMLTDNGQSRRERGIAPSDGLAFASKQLSRYGLLCPNNEEYFEFSKKQIDELLDYCKPDGIFFDMPFWPAGSSMCYCDTCKKRWAEEVGGEAPINPVTGSEAHTVMLQKKYQWMGEWTQKITDYVKSKNKDLAVYHNCASFVSGGSQNGCGEPVNLASDFCGGDLYGGIFNHSFACKVYKNITVNQPFEYMFSRCKPALRTHTLTKTEDEMKTAVAVTASHHGATLIIDAIDPVGSFDGRVYDRIGKAFDMQIPYEPYFRGEMAEDVAIYYSIRSRVNVNGSNKNAIDGATALSKMLIRNHMPYGVTGSFHRLEGYKAIFAPLLYVTESGDNERICNYVRNGGVLYTSGIGNKALVEELIGGKIGEKLSETRLYIAPKKEYETEFSDFNEKYPLPYDGVGFAIEGVEDKDVAAKFALPYTNSNGWSFASIHSDPPGVTTDIPAVVVKSYGKGKVIWSSVPLECGDTEEYGDIVLNLVKKAMGEYKPAFKSDAPGNVEITLFENEGEKLVNCTVLTTGYKAYPATPFKVAVKCEKRPSRVELLPNGETVDFIYSDGYAEFETRTLNIFDMYRIV